MSLRVTDRRTSLVAAALTVAMLRGHDPHEALAAACAAGAAAVADPKSQPDLEPLEADLAS